VNLVLSLAAILAASWLLARLLRPTGVPPLLGMIVAGVVVANLLPPDLLSSEWPGGTLRLGDVSAVIRQAVLAVVLLRVGLGLSRADLRAAGTLALRLAFLPMLFDAGLVALGGWWLLDLRPAVAAVLGFTVAAISPAIVIPGMIDLLGKREGAQRRVPTALLVGAPLDNVAALVALGVALDLALGDAAQSWGALAATVPIQVGGGILSGWLLGEVLGRLLGGIASWVRGALLLWVAAGLLIAAGQALGISFVLATITLGAVVRIRQPSRCRELSLVLGRVWGVIQYALFGLIGAALDLDPLVGVGLVTAAVIVMGQAGRATGVFVATVGARLSLRERSACVLSYVPKATIQAAVGGLALDRGLPEGDLILNAAVLAIVICAPIGVVALGRGADALLPHLDP
jgi:solute carrier family 9B (sodium/hydrogen exchanger), member 1/2